MTLTAAGVADDPVAVAALCRGEPADLTPVRAADWLARARDRLARDGRLQSGVLAGEVGMHPVRFARLFQRAFGRAPGDLRQSRQTARAINRIIRSPACLADIACDEGFADQAHMTRRVRAAVGLPPARLRRMFASA
jgi:AraC-like DNA-binding protein